MSIKGWPTQEKEDRLSPQYATVEPVRQLQNALSVIAHEFVREVGTDAVEANSTTTVINATGHAAQVGDVIRLTSGTLSGQEIKVYSVASDSITLAEELASAPAALVTFQILRHKYPVVEATGEVKVTGSFTEVATAADGGALPALVKVVGGYDGAAVQVIKTDSDGELQADVKSIEGIIDANNSTSTPLAGGGVFTGAWTDIKNYNSINLGVFSDVASATDGLRIEYSADGVSVHHYHLWTFAGGVNGVGYQLASEFRYFRVKYTNGAAAQTSFEIVANLKPTALGPSLYRASSTFTDETQVALTKGVIVGKTTGGGGGYVAVKVNPSGALTTETSISSIADVDGQQAMAASFPVVIASDQSAIPVTDNGSSLTVDGTVTANQGGTWDINNVSGTVSLPTGAATAARQDTGNNSLSSIDGKLGSLGQKAMTGSAPVVIASDQSAIPASQSGTWNINNISGTISLPTGAATQTTLASVDSTLTTLNGTTIPNRLPTTGTKTMSGSVSVTLASNQTAMPIYYYGRSAVGRARNDYTSANVTTAAYTQLISSTSAICHEVEIFDSSGQTLVLATGAAGAEADQVYIFPGGNGRIPLTIAASTRVSIKAVSATANAGEIDINLYG